MLTIEQRRKADRKRRERWRKRKLAQGCKQIQIMLAPEAQKILEHEKFRTGEPYVQIIHRAILELYKGVQASSFNNDSKPTITSETKKAQTSDSGKAGPSPRISGKEKISQQGQLKLF